MLFTELTHENRQPRIDPQILHDLSRHFRHLVGFALILVLIVAACARSSNRPLLSGDLPIAAPATATAGDQLDITVGPVQAAVDGTPIGLVMVGTYGPRVYNTTFESGLAHFTIPAQDTLQPGYLALIAAADEARGETSIILFSTQQSSVNYTQPTQLQFGVAGVSTPKNHTTPQP